MVNLHEIFNSPESKLPYMQSEFQLTPDIVALLEKKEYRHIRMLLYIMFHGNDDGLLKQETYSAVVSELQAAMNTKLFNTQNFLAQLGNLRSPVEPW
jgi:hypothetical protein